MTILKTEKEFQNFILEFEAGTLSKDRWRHADHLAMAFWYLVHFDEVTAFAKICNGIQKLNAVHGVAQTPTGGYHETWTIFFATLLKQYMDKELDQSLPLMEQLNLVTTRLADFRALTKHYYSSDLIMSWEARTTWCEPDLRSLRAMDL